MIENNNLKAVVIDDEKLSRDLIREVIREQDSPIRIIGESENVAGGCALINEHRPDVIFLDIELSGELGFNLLKMLGKREIPRVVMVTAHEKYARMAIREGVFDYLLKPLLSVEFNSVVKRLISASNEVETNIQSSELNADELEKKIILPHQTGFNLISLKEIIHLDADNNYTNIYMTEGAKIMSTQTLGKFELGIESAWFIRIHRSHIINLFHFREYLSAEGGYALMSNGNKVSISYNRLDVLKTAVLKLGYRIF